MKTLLKIIAILAAGLVGFLLLAQLVPYGRDHTNPPVLAEPVWDSPHTRSLFMRTCGDCHSNETAWPWYTNFAPVSWMVYRHVQEGRDKFNISAWGRQENEAEEAVEAYIHGDMPPKSYLPAHPEARLSETDRQALIDGLFATFGGKLRDSKGED